jgi:DNA invertase Pin-like site-specific DNA recombinase
VKTFLAYVRVSTTRQGETGVSLSQQRDAITAYAAKFDLNIVSWFEEQETAAKRGRPIWNKMLRLLRLRNATGVIIHKIDRSARNLRDWADLGEMIDAGIEVHFANESLDLNSRGGRLSADIQAVVASDYIRNLREETKKGFYGRVKQGFYPMPAPLGYLNCGKAKPKEIDEVKAPLIRKAFELYGTSEYDLGRLCVKLSELGLVNRFGKQITDNGLSMILNNPFYMGLIKIKKTGDVYEGLHRPLISKVLFEQVQSILRGKVNSRTQKHEFLFRKIVKCALCGYKLIGETHKGHVYYRCQIRDCPNTGIREEAVDDAVQEKLSTLVFSSEEKEHIALELRSLKHEWHETRTSQVSKLVLKSDVVTERLSRLTDAFLDGDIEKELFDQKKTALLLERRQIEDVLSKLKKGNLSIPNELEKFLELAGSAYSLYKTKDLEKQRRLLKTVTSNLAVQSKNVEFTLASPFAEVANRQKTVDGSPSKGTARNASGLLLKLIDVLSSADSSQLEPRM